MPAPPSGGNTTTGNKKGADSSDDDYFEPDEEELEEERKCMAILYVLHGYDTPTYIFLCTFTHQREDCRRLDARAIHKRDFCWRVLTVTTPQLPITGWL